jgi:hypothetical protein
MLQSVVLLLDTEEVYFHHLWQVIHLSGYNHNHHFAAFMYDIWQVSLCFLWKWNWKAATFFNKIKFYVALYVKVSPSVLMEALYSTQWNWGHDTLWFRQGFKSLNLFLFTNILLKWNKSFLHCTLYGITVACIVTVMITKKEGTCMKGEDICGVQTVHWTCIQGCAMAQVVSRQPLTTEAFVHAWVGFVVGKVSLAHIFPWVLHLSLVCIIPPWLSIPISHQGWTKDLFGGCSSETQSHPQTWTWTLYPALNLVRYDNLSHSMNSLQKRHECNTVFVHIFKSIVWGMECGVSSVSKCVLYKSTPVLFKFDIIVCDASL